MIITTEVKHAIGETVYLKTDTDQLPRLIYGFEVYANGLVYMVAQGINVSRHYEFELTAEKNILVDK